jgi:hypothetical protein
MAGYCEHDNEPYGSIKADRIGTGVKCLRMQISEKMKSGVPTVREICSGLCCLVLRCNRGRDVHGMLESILTSLETRNCWRHTIFIRQGCYSRFIDIEKSLRNKFPDNGGSKYLWNVSKFTRLHGAISQKTAIFILDAISTRNLTKCI